MTQTVDEFVYDPFSPDVMSNPLPYYQILRERFPVYYVEKYDTFFLSRFQDAIDFLSQPTNVFVTNEGSVFNRPELLEHNAGPTIDPPTSPMLGSHLNFGAPTYELVRQAHGKQLRPGHVKQLEPFIRTMVRSRLDEAIDTKRFDLVHEFTGVIAASTICRLFHIPLTEATTVLDNINAMTRTNSDGFIRAPKYQIALLEYVRPLVAARRAQGADGSWPLVDGMLDLRVDGRALGDMEIAANLMCVMVGGTETLPKVVAHGLLELKRHPDQLAEVRSDLPNNCAVAAEEMNRFCGPAQWFGRTAREETVVAGQEVQPGQRVVYLTQSANRDPREFDDPDEFRWNRPIPRTLAFGFGQHFCIGIHLARLEERIILEEFLARVDDYDIDVDRAVRLPATFQWGYSQMPIVINSTL
ncbi:cytochrome P450 [Gordonia rhizosphera]|uniref:Putative cytochrome P450 n=1 Tax=Gordonia rhizosphera NBRC 16068 TaxID=1108045 RepID=K6WF27_9ACTN|nr:cytochrome P450 [Gordonia rhizosphera]GAB92336.1 putative cytochrome P450 [Gordonia rhizosphera NBRC 16068]